MGQELRSGTDFILIVVTGIGVNNGLESICVDVRMELIVATQGPRYLKLYMVI